MNKAVAILAVCALFISGVVIGALGMHLFYVQRLMRPGEPPAMAGRLLTGYLARELDLTAAQQTEIREILGASRRQGAELRQRMRPEVEAVMAQTREAIEEILTPEQRRKLDEMRQRDRRPIERLFLGPADGRHGRPGGPPDGPGGGSRGRRHPPQP
jgi:Spy/CpxP family protein refolding chaperone